MIREAGATDLPEIAALAARAWWAHYPSIISPAQIEYMLARMYAPEVLARELAGGVRYQRLDADDGADGARLIAFAAWEAAAATARLHKLYVDPERQRAGHGRRLLAHVESEARAAGAARMALNVNKRNAPAIAFYERCGFRRAAAVVLDIGGGFVMDDFVMEKVLDADRGGTSDADADP